MQVSLLVFTTLCFALLLPQQLKAQTCTFNSKILASNDPFGACPIGTDTIIIRDTFEIDVDYEPMPGNSGLPFEGILRVEGGVLLWTSPVKLKLGSNARILLYNGGHIYPAGVTDVGCHPFMAIYFDVNKLAACSGSALHTFSDVNSAGCFDGGGICCDATITVKENSGYPNDFTLCQPGDSVCLSVYGSGNLDYDFSWFPNIGPEEGPYCVAQTKTTQYYVNITAIFDPYGPADPYLLTCSSKLWVYTNPTITLIATPTPVPCASSATGVVDLTVGGGTAPYKYLWSNGATTEDLNNLVADTYTVTVTDAKGCTGEKAVTVNTVDNEPPSLSCPSSANGIAEQGLCTVTISNIDAVFSDNCPAAELSYNITGATSASGIGQLSNVLPFETGTSNVAYTVDDGSNSVSCSFSINVQDTQFPTASNPPTITGIQCLSGIPPADPEVVTNEADNCGTPTVSFLNQSVIGGLGCPSNPMILSRKYRITDGSGNGITVTQLIHVADSTPPFFTQVPTNTTVNCESIPSVGAAKASDNCTEIVQLIYLGETRTNGACPDTYILTRTWRAVDDCANSAIATQTINVQDVTNPVFVSVPAGVTVSCESIPAPGVASATDNCDASVTISYLGETSTPGACQNSYTLRRVWKAEDNCGNTATAEQLISVEDNTRPTFTAVPANTTASCESIPAVGNPTATDNCDPSVIITYLGETQNNGACQSAYSLTRTWQAEDNCGNTSTATQLIAVQDITSPTFTSVPANETVSCESIPTVGTPVATDNCDPDVTITYNGETRTNGSCLYTYILTRKWTAIDNCGNSATTEQAIQVRDMSKPVFTYVPPDGLVSCDNIPNVGMPVASDNCTPSVSIVYNGALREDGACPNTYRLRRSWRATDDCGNVATAEQVIDVEDTAIPIFAQIPADITVSCDAIPSPGAATATDNCDAAVNISYNGEIRVDGACPQTYSLQREWIATDGCGNTALATQNITVQDNTAPVFTSVPPATTASCEALPAVGTPTATDNCSGNVTITYLGETVPGSGGACPGNYALVRTWEAKDVCGNTSTATQEITVQDISAPVILTVPANTTVSCSNIPLVDSPTASDNCDTDLSIQYDGQTRTDGNCANSYFLQRKWTVMDDCGNTTTAVQTITVEDNTAPVFTSVPAAVTASCDAIPAVGAPTAADDCAAAVSISYNGDVRIDGNCNNSYTLQRSWTAVDSCGNASTAMQIITVQDITAPVYTFVPTPITVNCDAIPSADTPAATDNCDADVSISYNGEVRIDGACPQAYVLQREWTATDDCGNTALATQIITVQDTTAPVFTSVPGPETASCENIPAVGNPTASDNCSGNVSISYLGETVSGSGGACPGNYAIIRSWEAKDECGNTSIATQELTVQDVSAPVLLTVPADAIVSCSNIPTVGTPTANDNCDTDLTINYNGQTRTDGNCPNSYALQRTWTISDDCGNATTAVQTITVEDITPPVFTAVPAAITVSCDDIPVVDTPVASDNCASNVTITYNGAGRIDGNCPDSYTLQRSWTATDSCGNAATAMQLITVQDITAPVFTAVPTDITVSCDDIPSPGSAAASDNCDADVSVTFSGEALLDGNCKYSYSIIRGWLATDNCGNTSTATQTLTVQDITPPVFTAVPGSVTVNCDAIPPTGVPTASDNCSSAVAITYLGETRTDGNCSGNYTLTRTWSAVDDCANTSTATQIIIVQDNSAPVVLSVPADATVSCAAIPAVGTPTATDNCDANLTINYNGAVRTDGNCPNSYTLTRSWTIIDDCGNASPAVQTLTIEDITSPVFVTAPADITVSCEAIPTVGDATAVDDCSSNVAVTFSGAVRTDGACPDSYTLTRTWVAQDSCGNTSTTFQTITVQDITAPNFTAIPPDITVSCDAIPAVFMPTAVDNCDAFVSINYNGQSRIDGNCSYSYMLRREWVASDNCGNASTAIQFITVQDINPPVFTALPGGLTVDCESIPPVGTPSASDNCDPSVSITYIGEIRTDGNCPSNYSLTRRWLAEDDCGNATTATQVIMVQDITNPVFTSVPADTLVNCDAIPAPGIPQATDNCSNVPSIVFDGETIMNSTSPDSYTLQRKWIATDDCGNATTALQTLTVQDTIAPAIVCPPSIALNADGATCSAIATFSMPLTSDNCSSSLSVTSSANSGQAFPIGTTTVTMTVSDPSNNIATCDFTVTALDTTAPVLVNCPPDLTFTTDISSCETIVDWPAPTVTDPCDDIALITPTVNIPSGSVLPTGVETVTYTAVDTSGNSTQCSFTITVQEMVAPELSNCPQDIVLHTDTCNATASWAAPLATDNCALGTLEVNIPSGSVFPETTTVVEYTATDLWGNTATCSFTVTVIDDVDPVFSGCPSSFSIDAGLCEVSVIWNQPTATDNCSANPMVFSVPAIGDTFPSGFTTVNVFVQDLSGNQDTCTFVVEVIGPAIGLATLPVDQSFIGCDAIVNWVPPVPTGICGPYTLESNYEPGDTFNIGVTEVIYTLEDTLGHTVTTSFNVTVTESILPVFNCPVSPIRVNTSGAVLADISGFITATDTTGTCDGVDLQFLFPDATDNCAPPLVTQMAGPLTTSIFDLGSHTLEFQALDAAGNTAICAVEIEVLQLLPLNPQVSDAIACEGDEVTLSATVISGATYSWDGPEGPYPDNNNIMIAPLDSTITGYYTVYATVNGCKTPLDSALVRIGKLPVAIDDLDYQVGTNEVLADFNVLLNDIYEDDDFTIELSSDLPGLINHGNGVFSFEAGNKNTTYSFFYTLCSKTCPDLCAIGTVSITARERICAFIPNIITPNGDGMNDYLVIPCLDQEPYLENHLLIFNQWGQKVYDAAPYSNDPDKAWRGTMNGITGKDLPDATYYYIFKARPSDSGLKGFVEIFR